jgi:hypothetical protein
MNIFKISSRSSNSGGLAGAVPGGGAGVPGSGVVGPAGQSERTGMNRRRPGANPISAVVAERGFFP